MRSMIKAVIVGVLTVLLATSPATAQVGVLKNTTISANGATSTIRLDAFQSVGISVVNSGSYTLEFEASANGGITWVSVGAVDVSDFTRDNNTTGAGTWLFGNQGFTHFRVRASAYASGAPVVYFSRGYGGVIAPLSAGSVSGSNSAAGATGSAVPASASYNAVNVGGTLRGQTGTAVGSHFAGAVQIMDGSGNAIVSFGGGTQYTQDAALTVGSTIGTMAFGRASAAAPTDVSADNDAVLPWYLRSGAQVHQPSFAGVLATTGTGASGTGVQRVVTATDSTIGTVTTLSQFGGQAITLGAGAVAGGTLRITEASDAPQTTALQLIDNAVQTVGAGTAGTNSLLAGGVYNSTPITLTNTQGSALQLDANGYLAVNIKAGAGSGGTAIADRATFTSGTTSFTPAGGFYQATPTQVTDGQSAAFGMTIGRALKVALSNADGSLATYATDSVMGTATYTEATSTGPLVGGVRSDTLSTKGNTNNEIVPFQVNADGAQYVQLAAGTNGGATPIGFTSAASTNSTNVKASAGTLYNITLVNTTATLYYLRLYNLSSAPTCSSATGYVATIPVPASTTGAGLTTNIDVGLNFGTGIGYCFTGGASSTDNTNAATGVYGFLGYK